MAKCKSTTPVEFSRTGALWWLNYVSEQLDNCYAVAAAAMSHVEKSEDGDGQNTSEYGLFRVIAAEAQDAQAINYLRDMIETLPSEPTEDAAEGTNHG